MATQNVILREEPPAAYSLRVESFSQLKKSKEDKFQSDIFNYRGYNWRLVFYPNGNKKDDGKDHISLYLKIDDANAHSHGVNVYYKLFVYNQLSSQYLVVQDDAMRCFNRDRKEWGFGKFLELATFEEPSNGYLVDDTCKFGADVYVVKQTGTQEEILSFVTGPADGTHKFSISNFRTKDQHKNEFFVGGRNWQLVVYPTGFEVEEGSHLTLSLKLADYETVSPKIPVYAEFNLKVVNRFNKNTSIEQPIKHFFNSSAEKVSSNLIDLRKLYDSTKGYISGDTIIVEVQCVVISRTTSNN